MDSLVRKRIKQLPARWLMILCLVASLIHFCPPEYITQSGAECSVCAIQQHDESLSAEAAPHGDCHDCCSIKSCDDKAPSVAKSNSSLQFEFNILIPLSQVEIALPIVEDGNLHQEFNPATPATGPPLERSSRAPPVFRLV